MTLAIQKLVLAIALSTIVAFSAGLATGRALATQQESNAATASELTSGAEVQNRYERAIRTTADYSVLPTTCTSALGPEDYETCKAQFGEQRR